MLVRYLPILLLSACCTMPAQPAVALTNQYGAHLLVDNLGPRGKANLSWARALVGKEGYVKTLLYGITKDTAGARQGWKDFTAECYRLDLIPVMRLGGVIKEHWVEPEADADGGYASIAAAVKRVVADLPRTGKRPLYIEVWNEPNLDLEWSGKSNIPEYARFFVAVSRAIRSIGDSRIKILNGAFALSPGSVEEACKAEPEFINAFDIWASHPYPLSHPPEYNIHDGTAKNTHFAIDAYLEELRVLEKLGRKDVKVMVTETGYALGEDVFLSEGFAAINEYNRADYMMRAFRDFYPKWPEVLAVFPFEFSDPGWSGFDWVYPDSGTDENGLPTKTHYQYDCVLKLAKPTDATGAISGKVTDADFAVPLSGAPVKVKKTGYLTVTDPMGNYFVPKLQPGEHGVSVTLDGFAGIESTAKVAAGKNAVLDFRLEAKAKGHVWGHVEDGMDGKPIPEAEVTLTPGGRKVKADADGWFELNDLPPIAFDLRASKKGFTVHDLTGLRVMPDGVVEAAMRIAENRAPDVKNMATNSSFEQVSDPAAGTGFALKWETLSEGRFSVSTQVHRTGLRSERLDAVSGKACALRQITHYNTMEPGRQYCCGVWLRTEDLVPEDDGGAWMSFAFTGNGGEVIQEIPCGRKLSGNSDWAYLEAKGVAPEGSKRLSLNLWIKAKSGAAYFDDAFIGKIE